MSGRPRAGRLGHSPSRFTHPKVIPISATARAVALPLRGASQPTLAPLTALLVVQVSLSQTQCTGWLPGLPNTTPPRTTGWNPGWSGTCSR
jgi:hypothetical protein